MITDRPRFIVQQANTDVILERDLEVQDPKFGGQLSGPGVVQFQLKPYANRNIDWGKNKQWVHVEMEFDGVRKIVLSTIVKSAEPDEETGLMNIETYGFSDYLKNKPWLENYNDIAVDPFTIVQRLWNHVQSFPNAQLGVTTYPASSGTQMLPGFGFNGSSLSFDFFALFIRAIDFNDCAQQLTSLARDIPFDYVENSWWNVDRTEITKRLDLGYPKLGVRQEHLSFIMGENVIRGEVTKERDIGPITDVGIRGWSPGTVYNARLGNTDDTQFREFIIEEDAKINSTERAAAYARRKLQLRTVPKHWKKIIIEPNHPNAPWGRFDLGDEIFVRGNDPWYGEIAEWHRVMSWTYDIKSGYLELGLKVEGAFNYDPIDYDPNIEVTLPPNDLSNGYFGENLNHWSRISGAWIRMASFGRESPGCVRIDLDGGIKVLRSERIAVGPNQQIDLKAFVRYDDVVSTSGQAFQYQILTFLDSVLVAANTIDSISGPSSTLTWQRLEGSYTTPSSGVNEYAVQLVCTSSLLDGTAYWDDISAAKVV